MIHMQKIDLSLSSDNTITDEGIKGMIYMQ
jgi:hypothetical protein